MDTTLTEESAIAATYRAPLGAADFSLALTGRTGYGKSELAALAQQHFGESMDARHLPGSWSSTANALEALAFHAKDAVLTLDDFNPVGTGYDVARTHKEADRVLRAQGNSSGRMRMRADASLRTQRPPRGLILMTGEDVPRGHSLRARVFVLEVGPDSIAWDELSSAQQAAASGVYAEAMSAYVQWLSPERTNAYQKRVRELRDELQRGGHKRTPEIVANLA
ncbi:MAG TPA: DUF927 domain-containing protein, partial [Thermoleophilia bacterium]|nr:DUF927 domain-containing protein [Thermoleophilia bacterium]